MIIIGTIGGRWEGKGECCCSEFVIQFSHSLLHMFQPFPSEEHT